MAGCPGRFWPSPASSSSFRSCPSLSPSSPCAASQRLFALGYGVQGPLMIVLAVRFFALRELTPPYHRAYHCRRAGLVCPAMATADKNPDGRSGLVRGIRLVGITLLLGVGLYISLFMAFYALPVAAGVINIAGDILSRVAARLRAEFLGWHGSGRFYAALSRVWLHSHAVLGHAVCAHAHRRAHHLRAGVVARLASGHTKWARRSASARPLWRLRFW